MEDAARHICTAWAADDRPPRIGITGSSYGGYSTLMGMTYFAEAYDAGVQIVGISGLRTFLLNTAPYRRVLRVSEYGAPDLDRDALHELSPAHSAESSKPRAGRATVGSRGPRRRRATR